eukprot:gene59573-81525_t
MALVIPQECQENAAVARYLDGLVAGGGPVDELIHFDLRQSMRNGGGPACLRLRVALTDQEASAMHQGVLMTEALYHALVAWVEKHYRDHLEPKDLADPALALARHFITQARKLNRTESPTVRHVFEYAIARGRGHFLAIGSAEEVADTIQHWFENGAADGFNVCPPHLPAGLDDFIELVLPILRARGLFRDEYTGRTFAAHFGGALKPANRFEGARTAQAEFGRITETHHRV